MQNRPFLSGILAFRGIGHEIGQFGICTFNHLSCIYTVLHIFRQVLFGAGNQGNHQNFEKSLLTNKL